VVREGQTMAMYAFPGPPSQGPTNHVDSALGTLVVELVGTVRAQ
jgi:hypothetical protein